MALAIALIILSAALFAIAAAGVLWLLGALDWVSDALRERQ